MMFKSVIVLLCVSGTSAFVSAPAPKTTLSSSSSLEMNNVGMKKAAAAFVAATFVLGNIDVAPAFAMDDSDFGFGSSTQVIAGRSGGRAGGRSSARRAPSRAPSRAPRRSSTVINRTTIVRPPVVYGGGYGGGFGGGYGYNPMGGLGLSMGLNAIGNIGRDNQDYRQENEIRDTRSALQQSQAREAALELRLSKLEQGQGQAMTQEQLLMQQQMFQQQQQQQAAAAVAK